MLSLKITKIIVLIIIICRDIGDILFGFLLCGQEIHQKATGPHGHARKRELKAAIYTKQKTTRNH